MYKHCTSSLYSEVIDMAEYYTIKDMASEFKCTYEAVRQQTSRYSKELAGHSHLDGKTRYYDDWAVEFLRERRKKNPIIIEQTDTKQLIEELQQKNTVLLEKVAVQADKLAAQSEELRQNDKLLLEAENNKQLVAHQREQLEQNQETMAAQQNEIAELKVQLEAERNRKLSFAERFRGRKRRS